MKVDVTTMRVQCSTCGEPVDVVELVGTDSGEMSLEPCGHTMPLAHVSPMTRPLPGAPLFC